MLSPKDLDHHLLFKKLVILKDEELSVETEVESKAEEIVEIKEGVTEELTDTTAEIEAQDAENIDVAIASDQSQESTEEASKPSPLAGSSIIICKKEHKDILMAAGSNLSKIIFALELQKFQQNVYSIEEINAEQEFEQGAFIWTIGLSTDEQVRLKSADNSRMIHSPYMEANMSKADKIKMYEPLKQFATLFHKS